MYPVTIAAITNENTLAASVVQGLAAVVDENAAYYTVTSGGGGPFTNTTVAGLQLWLRSDYDCKQADTTPATSAGQYVEHWGDGSVNVNSAEQTNPIYLPQISGSINGIPVVGFANNAGFKTSLHLASTLTLGGSNDFTIYYVGTTPSSTSAVMPGLCDVVGNSQACLFTSSGGNVYDSSTGTLTLASGFATSTNVVIRVRKVGTSYYWKYNGSSEVSATATLTTLALKDVGLGLAAVTGGGSLGEVLAFSGALSSGDQTTVEDYLYSRWALRP